jgi:hypothetical protein
MPCLPTLAHGTGRGKNRHATPVILHLVLHIMDETITLVRIDECHGLLESMEDPVSYTVLVSIRSYVILPNRIEHDNSFPVRELN